MQDWIGAQITNCATPLHPVVTDLLNAYAASCFAATEFSSANCPLSEEFVLVSTENCTYFKDERRINKMYNIIMQN